MIQPQQHHCRDPCTRRSFGPASAPPPPQVRAVTTIAASSRCAQANLVLRVYSITLHIPHPQVCAVRVCYHPPLTHPCTDLYVYTSHPPDPAGRPCMRARRWLTLRFEEEEGEAVLYCYELQVAACAQQRGLGSWLVGLLEQIVSWQGGLGGGWGGGWRHGVPSQGQGQGQRPRRTDPGWSTTWIWGQFV